MKKVTYTVLSLLLLASAAFGQGGPISGFTELTDTATSDELAIVDKSATPPATGTTKRITVANLLKLLHGDLDVNDFAIVSTGAGDIDITPDTTGNVVLDGIYWPQSDGTEGQWITTDASAQLSFTSDLWHIEDFAFRAISGEKTVSSGVLTVTETYTRVGGEGDSADIVDTITQTGATDGQVLILGITSEPITFADGTTGGDNLDLGADVLLDSVNERLILQFNGTNWVQLANSANIETVEKTVSETFTILEPDQVQPISDEVLLKYFPAEEYPNGVTMVSWHIGASASISDVFNLLESASPTASTPTTMESITMTTATEGEDDGTFTDGDVAADGYVFLDFNATVPDDVAFISVTITYTVD